MASPDSSMSREIATAAKDRAIETIGGVRKLAAALDISSAAVSQWPVVPAARVLAVERVTGIPRSQLRPDLYPPEAA